MSEATPRQRVDETTILNTLMTIVPERACIEIRGQKPDGFWWSGFYDREHLPQIAHVATVMDMASKGIYVTLNTTNPDLLLRRKNRMDTFVKKNELTCDEDITNWDFLPIDIDPQRPTGISSTDAELNEAYRVAVTVADYLASCGFSRPLIACSGNGWHLLYKIDLPRSNENDGIIKSILDALAEKFNTRPQYDEDGNEIPQIKIGVDTSNNNPSRIFKLYGTMARKGDSSPQRPHRLSYIHEEPDPFEITPTETLFTFIENHRTSGAGIPAKKTKGKLKSPAEVTQRHPELLKAVGIMVKGGFEYPAILSACRELNAAFPEPKPDDVLELEIQKIYDYVIDKNADKEQARQSRQPDTRLSEVAVAERFVDSLAGDALFNNSTKRWHVWDGRVWRVDDRNIVPDRAREYVKTLYIAAAQMDPMEVSTYLYEVKKLNSKTGVNNIISLAAIQLTRTSDDFNQNPHVLNLQNGTLDFTGGNVVFKEQHDKADMCSFIGGAVYDPSVPVPDLWLNHIETITGGDAELGKNIQEILGYILDGGNPNEYILILHGGGRNGKSVTLRTILHILGDYGLTVNPLTLMEHGNKTISPERMKMQGKRLIVAQEPNKQDTDSHHKDTSSLDSGFLKAASGKDAIPARELYSNVVKDIFVTGLITFSTNPLPKVSDDSIALWERLITIPFGYIIPAWQRDPTIEEKFKAQSTGILNWLVEGLLRTKTGRIKMCKAIKDDVADYRLTVDEYAGFVHARVEDVFDGEIPAQTLYKEYLDYQKKMGFSFNTETAFGSAMKRKFNWKKSNGCIFYRSIKIKSEQSTVV